MTDLPLWDNELLRLCLWPLRIHGISDDAGHSITEICRFIIHLRRAAKFYIELDLGVNSINLYRITYHGY